MNLTIYVTSIGLGILFGFLYTLSFPKKGKEASFFTITLLPFIRFATFGFILYLLLLSNVIHFIIFMPTFLVTFWFLILKQKV